MRSHRFTGLVLTVFSFLVSALAAPLQAADETSFAASFATTGTVEEANTMSNSGSADWWVNSGGRLISSNGAGKTVQGSLSSNDPWRVAYAASNPLDTDQGYHPQNIFRLVTRGRWRNFRQEAFFRIAATNLSASPNRAGHNGILFFERYQSGDTLYYAGIRVDGAAVIKKKLAGTYTTLAYLKIYPGTYHAATSPNLLPVGEWIGMRTEVEDIPGGGVSIRLFVSDPSLGEGWTEVLDAVDTGTSSPAILNDGYAGVRTDFMDVELDDYEASPLSAPPTPTPTRTSVPTPTRTPTRTPTPQAPTPVPTQTPSAPPASTPTPTKTPTQAPVATPTKTPTKTPTQAPAATPTPASCSVSISPSSKTVPPSGATGQFAVTAAAGCSWSASSNQPWVVLAPPAAGFGNGTVVFQVLPKTSGGKRMATILVGGRSFRITQTAN